MKSLGSLVLVALMAALATSSPLPAAPQEEPFDRARASAEILARWSPGLEDGGAELRGVLARLDAQALAAAAQAKTSEEVNSAVFRRPGPLALGDEDSDLVYFPLAPCRLVDTRAVPTGPSPIIAGTARIFDANNDLTPQGGAAAGCGVPLQDPAALAVTITAVNPEGPGSLRAYPNSGPVPTASVLNYALPGSGLNLANTTILPLNQNTFNPWEFAIRADVSTVHVVVDVVGYFFSPLSTPPACETFVRTASIPANSDLLLLSPLCPAGTILTGGGYATGATTTQIWVSDSTPRDRQWVCRAISTRAIGTILGCYARCCSIPGR